MLREIEETTFPESKESKPKISVSLDPNTFDWLQKNIRNRSAFIRELIEEFRTRTQVDSRLTSVETTVDQLKGLGLILVPGKAYRSILELGVRHDPDTVTSLIRESGRLLGVYFSNYFQDPDWLESFQQLLTDLFLDVNQISLTLENASTLAVRIVSAVDSEETLPLMGYFFEEALKRLRFNLSEWRMVFEQGIGMLSQKYTSGY